MGGGLMQLVAYGAQDIYLTGNPQITFFKVVYRRHTNFSMESIAQTFNGSATSAASNLTATVSRNGDLVAGMYLDVLLPTCAPSLNGANYTNWVNNTGHAYIDSVELEIGGQKIDKHYGHWLDVWNELTDHHEDEQRLINKNADTGTYLNDTSQGNTATIAQGMNVVVPLKFWFNRNPGLALPLIALQYHEVKVKLQTRSLAGMINTDGTVGVQAAAPTVTLFVDYIYLDTDERRRFAQQSHEYLIEQLQYQSDQLTASTKLNLNHPVKELIWTVTNSNATTEVTSGNSANPLSYTTAAGSVAAGGNDYFNYVSASARGVVGTPAPAAANSPTEIFSGQYSDEAFGSAILKLNGHDRFPARNASYFRTVQPLQSGHRVPEKHVYCYSFALKPEEHQPSGTCNFSRIDNARLDFQAHTSNGCTRAIANNTATGTNNINVYAVNYNVLRVMSGMGGLAYSN